MKHPCVLTSVIRDDQDRVQLVVGGEIVDGFRVSSLAASHKCNTHLVLSV